MIIRMVDWKTLENPSIMRIFKDVKRYKNIKKDTKKYERFTTRLQQISNADFFNLFAELI